MKFTFQDSKTFRTWGHALAILSITYMAIFDEKIGMIILLAASIICDLQYKCPYCKKSLDIRTKPSELEYCPRCGEKLL